MPDQAVLGARPVVRRVSATHHDIVHRFEPRRPSQTSIGGDFGSSNASSGAVTPTGKAKAKSRGSSRPKTEHDINLEEKVLSWIHSVIHERPTTDYEHFIQDGSILSKVMTSIVFNSVPVEDIDCEWGANPAYDRATSLIREIKRYGVTDVFEPEDLIERRNIPKVTKCLLQLSRLAASDRQNLIHSY